jgi:hypothetical protein
MGSRLILIPILERPDNLATAVLHQGQRNFLAQRVWAHLRPGIPMSASADYCAGPRFDPSIQSKTTERKSLANADSMMRSQQHPYTAAQQNVPAEPGLRVSQQLFNLSARCDSRGHRNYDVRWLVDENGGRQVCE